MLEILTKPLIDFFSNFNKSMLIFASICLLAIVLAIYYLKLKKLINLMEKIPGPKCSAIIGKLLGNLELFWTIKDSDDISMTGFQLLTGLAKLYQCTKSGIFRAWLGPFENVIVVFRADTVEPLLSSNIHIEKSKEYKFFETWLGLGLLTSTGDRWRSHRKLLTHSFHFKILENFVPIINGQQKTMISIIENELDKNNGIIQDIRPIITNCALDVICETAMGVSVNAQTDQNSDYVQSIRNVLILFLQRFLSPWLWNETIYRLSTSGNQFKQNTTVLHKFTDSVIKERKLEILKKLDENKDENSIETALLDIGSKRRLAFLDSLLIHHIKNPKEFTEIDIREEVDTFMFEGHDTTSAAIEFALLLIGHDLDVQAKIHEELDLIFVDDYNREITIDDLRNMKYLEQCIKEALRLYPSVPWIARKNNEPFFVGEYQIPKHTTCLLLFYMLHRDPDYFPNPEVFDPNRFSTDVSVGRHPYAYVPFSAGPRNCIGQKFALLEEKAIIASILRQYRIKSLIQRNELKFDIAAILKPNCDIKMSFEKRFT